MPYLIGEVEVTNEVSLTPSAVLYDGAVTADGDLTVQVNNFFYDLVGTKGEYGGSTNLAVTDNTINYVYLDDGAALQISTAGYPSGAHIRLARVIASGGFIVRIVLERAFFTAAGSSFSPTGLPEVTINREVPLTTVLSQQLYFAPLGEHFLDAASETELDYNGTVYHVGDGFYSHIHRSLSPYMNVTDAMIGIHLTSSPPAGVPMVLRWKQRTILVQPQTMALVHCTNFSGTWRPDYSIARWNQNNLARAPNAIQVTLPPAGYVVEWWRLTTQKGGDHLTGGSGYRSGRRYLPVFRGPALSTDNESLFLKTQFDVGSNRRSWRHFRVCYYNPTTGARSGLSSEVVISADTPDQHNGHGPCRYTLWINR